MEAGSPRTSDIGPDGPPPSPGRSALVRLLPIAIITIGAAAMRFIALDAKCLWIDEALSYHLSRLSLPEIIAISRSPGNVHPPLYFVLLHFWMLVAGDSELALRTPAAIAGTACVPAAYLLLRELLRHQGNEPGPLSAGQARLAAYVFAILVAVNPLQVFASREVRGYSLGVLLWLLGSLALARALRPSGPRVRALAAFALCAAALCYTHNVGLLMVAAQCLFLLQAAVGRRASRESHAPLSPAPIRPAVAWLVCGLIALAYLPWLAVGLRQASHVNSAATVAGGISRQPFRWSAVPRETYLALLATQESHWDFPWWCAFGVTVFLVLLLLRGMTRRSTAWTLLSLNALVPLWAMAAFSSTSVRTLYSARYLIFPMVPCLGCLALFVAERRNVVVRGLLSWLLVNGALYCLDLNLNVVGPAAAPGMRAAARHILGRRSGAEPVFTVGPFEQAKLAYSARGRLAPRLVDTDPGREFWGRRYFPDTGLISSEELTRGSWGTIWLVSENHTRLSLDLRIPDHWEILEVVSFPQQLQWERPVRVMHINTRGAPRGAVR